MNLFKKKTKELIQESAKEVKNDFLKKYEGIIFLGCIAAIASIIIPYEKPTIVSITNNYYGGYYERTEKSIY